MDTSRQALRRSPGSASGSPGAADLPCYEVDELTDFQVSTPMPARRHARPPLDGEITEALDAAGEGRGDTNGVAPRKRHERTQPISLDRAAPPPAERRAGTPKKDRAAGAAAEEGAAEEKETAGGWTVAPPEPTRVAPGVVLCGRYVIEKKVAHYGMGHVYKALDRYRKSAGAPLPWVALKFARGSAGGDGETSTLLRQEFLKLARLRHANIVDVFDITRHDDLEFIVMEWLSGETLADLLARITTRRIALDRAMEIVRCTARALAHAHDLGIVHGDVKPSNIFLTNARTVKVLDFGSSGASASGDGERNWATRAYASTDVLDGRPPQPHDDVFALGVTAYCLFSGERPFGEQDACSARAKNLRPPPLPEDALEKWPAVRRALSYDAIDRPGNARLFLQEFDEASVPERAAAPARGSPTVAYGAVAATLLASIVWWSVQGVGELPAEAGTALARAERALAEGRLVEPENESAWALYSTVLELQPDNRRALEGLEEIAERYLARARDAVAADDPGAALADLAVAREVSPGHFGIPLVEALIESRGRDILIRARHAAETDVGRAEALVLEAEKLLPGDHPALAAARDAIATQQARNRVGELLQEIDDRILAERLSVPTGDSALDLLRQAGEIAPGDPRIPLAANRIMTALLFQAMFAISSGDLAEAEDFLAMARGMDIRHLALARAEYELARARRAALAARNGNRLD